MSLLGKPIYAACAVMVLLSLLFLVSVHYWIFHPLQSNDGIRAKAVQNDLHCADCITHRFSRLESCEKCENGRYSANRNRNSSNCQLTGGRENYVKREVERQVRNAKVWVETVQKMIQDSGLGSSLQILAENPPLPSARWYLDNTIVNKGHGEAMNLTRWVSRTGYQFAYTLEDIEKGDEGEMMINSSGWYAIHVQLEFICEKPIQEEFTVEVKAVPKNKNERGSNNLLRMTGTPLPESFIPNETCLVLKKQRVFKLLCQDKLIITATFPKTVRLSTDLSQSYFGVHMVRGVRDSLPDKDEKKKCR